MFRIGNTTLKMWCNTYKHVTTIWSQSSPDWRVQTAYLEITLLCLNVLLRPGFALETSFSWRTTWSFARQTMKMGWWKKATLLISAEWAKKTKEEKSCWRVIQQSRKKKNQKKTKQTENHKCLFPGLAALPVDTPAGLWRTGDGRDRDARVAGTAIHPGC